MAQLTDDQQRFIVMRLACFAKPTQIVADFKAEYGVTIEHLSQISYYDPNNRQGADQLAPELTELFWNTRAHFIQDVDSIPIAHQTFRLRELDALLDHEFVKMGPTLRMQVLEQAAKERGGMFTQRINGATPAEVGEFMRERLGKVRAAIDAVVTRPEERKRVLAAIKEAEKLEE